MNNNLVPEKRLDKNGRLNTKHVRVNKASASTPKVPAPSLPSAKKKLSVAQTRPKPRTVAYAGPGDYELNKRLGTDHDATEVTITASDAEFYAVCSVTSRPNAFALLQSGIRTAEEASNYLEDNGFDELLSDNSALCEEALLRKIPPNRFIEASANLRGPEGSEHYLDALEVYSSSIPRGTGSNSNLVIANHVYDGDIRLEDLKEITFPKFNGFRDKDALVQELREIANGTANKTTAELITLMGKHAYSFRDSLELAAKYGAEATAQFDTPNTHYSDDLEERGVDRERTLALLKYSDQVRTAEYENNIYKAEGPSYELLEKCYDTGVTPLQVANDDYTEQQLDGLNLGITPSVSSGWL